LISIQFFLNTQSMRR